ncbi:hypothetical protein D3C76_1214100 [compost metagenome]
MSKNCFTPRPSQVGQAPAGLLKENSLGSSSLMACPQIGQAKRAEKIISSPGSSSIGATRAMPSASFSAVSKDSARRCCRSARTLKRSTTTSMVCFFCLSSLGASSSS